MNGQPWATLVRRYLSGDVTALLAVRGSIGTALRERRFARENDELMARAIAADLEVTMVDRVRAAHLLEPFVRQRGGRLEVCWLACDRLYGETVDAFIAGRVLGQIANLCCRWRRYDVGTEVASKADERLRVAARSRSAVASQLAVEMAGIENALWQARMEWRLAGSKRPHAAKRQLKDAVERLVRVSAIPSAGPFSAAVDRLLGIAFNLRAFIEWTEGSSNQARRHGGFAVVLLSRARDDVRLAFALHGLGMFEATPGGASIAWAAELQRRAAEIFERHGHPWRYRALNEAARCTLRAGRDPQDARTRLGAVTAAISKRAIPDAWERQRAQAEACVTEIWIEGRLGRWDRCIELADQLLSVPELSLSHRSEAKFQKGRALARLAPRNAAAEATMAAAQEVLLEGRADAQACGRLKLVASCELALAELLGGHDLPAAYSQLQEAKSRLAKAGAHSAYLSGWAAALSSTIVPPMEKLFLCHWGTAFDEFQRSYDRFNWKRAGSRRQKFLEITGQSSSAMAAFYKRHPALREASADGEAASERPSAPVQQVVAMRDTEGGGAHAVAGPVLAPSGAPSAPKPS